MKEAFINPYWGLITLDMQYQDYAYLTEKEGDTPLSYEDWLTEGDEDD